MLSIVFCIYILLWKTVYKYEIWYAIYFITCNLIQQINYINEYNS
jgi:hypothetical protein